jgi:hypothetical protein
MYMESGDEFTRIHNIDIRYWYMVSFALPKGKISLHNMNSKMYLREIRWDGVDWIDRAQDKDQWRALVNTVLNLRVP